MIIDALQSADDLAEAINRRLFIAASMSLHLRWAFGVDDLEVLKSIKGHIGEVSAEITRPTVAHIETTYQMADGKTVELAAHGEGDGTLRYKNLSTQYEWQTTELSTENYLLEALKKGAFLTETKFIVGTEAPAFGLTGWQYAQISGQTYLQWNQQNARSDEFNYCLLPHKDMPFSLMLFTLKPHGRPIAYGRYEFDQWTLSK